MDIKSDFPNVKGYNIQIPTKEVAMSNLCIYYTLSKADETWEAACHEMNVDSDTRDIQDLTSVFECLSKQKGFCGVIGRSLLVKLNAYQHLSH